MMILKKEKIGKKIGTGLKQSLRRGEENESLKKLAAKT